MWALLVVTGVVVCVVCGKVGGGKVLRRVVALDARVIQGNDWYWLYS